MSNDKSYIKNEQQIKDATDIVKVIGEFVRLKKKGCNYFCSCPFHGEKTPSFVVSPAKNIFKCFGCEAKGDAIRFIQQHENLSYRDSLLWLADYFRVTPEFEDGQANTFVRRAPAPRPAPAPPAPPSLIPQSEFIKSISCIDSNNLIIWLTSLFGAEKVQELRRDYPIGTSKHWNNAGASIFFQVDDNNNVRGGKIMLYDQYTGKRRRDVENSITWVHTVKKDWNYNLSQTFYGAHLINQYPEKTVGIVESEKGCLLCSVYFPEYVFIATGALNNGVLDANIGLLVGRTCVMFPDLSPLVTDESKIANLCQKYPGYEYDRTKGSAYNLWAAKAYTFQDIADITVFDYLENNATEAERTAKDDIGDYIVRMRLREQFKAEFLQQPAEDKQAEIWHRYERAGLPPLDALNILNDLLNNHNFSIAA